jgi:hypothetical protein
LQLATPTARATAATATSTTTAAAPTALGAAAISWAEVATAGNGNHNGVVGCLYVMIAKLFLGSIRLSQPYISFLLSEDQTD